MRAGRGRALERGRAPGSPQHARDGAHKGAFRRRPPPPAPCPAWSGSGPAACLSVGGRGVSRLGPLPPPHPHAGRRARRAARRRGLVGWRRRNPWRTHFWSGGYWCAQVGDGPGILPHPRRRLGLGTRSCIHGTPPGPLLRKASPFVSSVPSPHPLSLVPTGRRQL
jgi:hypothetical protein